MFVVYDVMCINLIKETHEGKKGYMKSCLSGKLYSCSNGGLVGGNPCRSIKFLVLCLCQGVSLALLVPGRLEP